MSARKGLSNIKLNVFMVYSQVRLPQVVLFKEFLPQHFRAKPNFSLSRILLVLGRENIFGLIFSSFIFGFHEMYYLILEMRSTTSTNQRDETQYKPREETNHILFLANMAGKHTASEPTQHTSH